MGLPGGRGSPIECGVLVTVVRLDAQAEPCGRLAWRPARPAPPTGPAQQQPGRRVIRRASRTARSVRPVAPGCWLGGARTLPLGSRWGAAGCRRRRWAPRVCLAGARPPRPVPGWVAGGVTQRTRVRASLDMIASDRSTGALGAVGWLLGGDGWPPGQLPPATGHPCPAPAAGWASATHQSRMGGLLSPFGDALLGQRLAQPGMLVVHVSSPSSACQQPVLRTGSGWAGGSSSTVGSPTSALFAT
jgi:hypothetical protein